MDQKPYKWKRKDKILYALSMIPFIIVFIGTVYLLSTYSIYLAIIMIGMYLLTNIFLGWMVPSKYRPTNH